MVSTSENRCLAIIFNMLRDPNPRRQDDVCNIKDKAKVRLRDICLFNTWTLSVLQTSQ